MIKLLLNQKGRPKINANKFIINEARDIDGDGEFNLKDVAKQLKANKQNEWTPLEGDGDFRSDECIKSASTIRHCGNKSAVQPVFTNMLNNFLITTKICDYW